MKIPRVKRVHCKVMRQSLQVKLVVVLRETLGYRF
jgi:hypothetical protein